MATHTSTSVRVHTHIYVSTHLHVHTRSGYLQAAEKAASMIQSSFRGHSSRRKSRGIFAAEMKRALEV